MAITTVQDLREALARINQNAKVVLSVEWSADTATSDDDEEICLEENGGVLNISSKMSGCNTELDFNDMVRLTKDEPDYMV